MTDWKKVAPELATRFLAALPDVANVERRQMFGCPCAFVNGNMFAGLHEDRQIVRLPDEAALRPCVIMGRTMKQYALFPDAAQLTPKAIAQWIRRGHAFTSTLPAKVKKVATAAKPAKAAVAPGPVKSSAAAQAMKAQRTAAPRAVKAPSGTPRAKR